MPIPAAPDPSADIVRRLLARHLPGWRATSVVPLGEGVDNAAFDVDGELVVRCSTHPDPGERSRRVLRESRVLATVAAASPLPVPVPRFTAAEDGCLAYARLPGSPLLDLPAAQRSSRAAAVGAALGGLLTALSTLPVELMAEVAGVDDTPPGEWLDECRDLLPQLTSAIPGRHLPTVRAFLDADPPDPADRLVFTHDDLGIEHVLADPDTGRVTGVLDWGTPPSPTPPTTSAWSCAISGSRPSRPHWPPTGPLPTATEPSGNASTSTPAAPCSRTSPTDWTPAGTPTSRRACSGWPDCSPPDGLRHLPTRGRGEEAVRVGPRCDSAS